MLSKLIEASDASDLSDCLLNRTPDFFHPSKMSSDGGRRGAFVEDWLKRHVVASDAAKKPMSEDLVFKTQNLRLRGRANRSSPVVAVRQPAGLTARQQRRTGIFKVAPKQQRSNSVVLTVGQAPDEHGL